MKNGLVIWNVVLTLVAGYLLFTQFGTKKSSTSGNSSSSGDSTVANKVFKIAYFEMDSVAANFDMVKEVKAELAKKEDAMNAEMDKLTKNFQQKYVYYQNQAQAGTLTEAQSQTAAQELKTMEDQLKNRKQALDQEYSDYMVRRQNEIKTSIEAFLREYNKTRDYSYIVSYEQGLFYYRDTAYNITADVIKGLNSQHKPKTK